MEKGAMYGTMDGPDQPRGTIYGVTVVLRTPNHKLDLIDLPIYVCRAVLSWWEALFGPLGGRPFLEPFGLLTPPVPGTHECDPEHRDADQRFGPTF